MKNSDKNISLPPIFWLALSLLCSWPTAKADAAASSTEPGKIYIIIFNWPANGTFELPVIKHKITGDFLLAGHEPVQILQSETGVTLKLPVTAPDKVAAVVCLETSH